MRDKLELNRRTANFLVFIAMDEWNTAIEYIGDAEKHEELWELCRKPYYDEKAIDDFDVGDTYPLFDYMSWHQFRGATDAADRLVRFVEPYAEPALVDEYYNFRDQVQRFTDALSDKDDLYD